MQWATGSSLHLECMCSKRHMWSLLLNPAASHAHPSSPTAVHNSCRGLALAWPADCDDKAMSCSGSTDHASSSFCAYRPLGM
jgi:hypothetical protein